MKTNLKILLYCLLTLFVSHSAEAQKYVKDPPTEPVKVFVDNGNGEIQIVFKWDGNDPPTTAPKITFRITDAVGTFNTIPAKDNVITFQWEQDSTQAKILIGRLKVENAGNFIDASAPYTGYVVFASEPAGMAPAAVKFELRKTPISNALNVEGNNLAVPGTNYLPSPLNPVWPGVLYLVLGVLFLLRRSVFKGNKVVLLLVSAGLILIVGLAITLFRNPGRQYSSVYTDSLQLPDGRNDQPTSPARYSGILTSEKSGWGKIYLEKIEGNYHLTFRDLQRAGEYNGKIASDILGSTSPLSVKVKVADWVLYFLVMVLGGILATHLMTTSVASPLEFRSLLVVAGGSVLAVLVTHFTLYTDTWGSPLDYVTAFATGAGTNLASRYALAAAYRSARVWLQKK